MHRVKVLCAGATKAPFAQVVAAFEQRTGHPVDCTFGAVGTLVQMLNAGAEAELVVLNRKSTKELQLSGKLSTRSFSLGSVGVGLAVPPGSKVEDLSTPARLREVLLQAPSLAYGDPAHGDSSGVHFRSVLEKLHITEKVADKTRLADSGLHVVELVKKGEVAMGATQSSVILSSEGVMLAALLPPDLQKNTEYVCALVAAPEASPSAVELWTHLQQPDVGTTFQHAGFA